MNDSHSARTHGRHGHARGGIVTPEYAIWKTIIQRCQNPNHDQYASYGGAGISVCESWRGPDGFKRFLEDVGHQPSKGAGIRRFNLDGNFEPSNVEWGDTRRCRMLTYDGRTQSVADWARELEVEPTVLYTRLHMGWSVEDVLGRFVSRRCAYGPRSPRRPA